MTVILGKAPVPADVDDMTPAEMFAAAGVDVGDIEKGTYIYINKSDELVVCSALMREASPTDEYRGLYRSDFPKHDRDELKRLHGGAREGAGRPPGEPQTNIRIAATAQEKEEILAGTTPRQRAEVLLKLVRSQSE